MSTPGGVGLSEADNQVLLQVSSDCSEQLDAAWAALKPTIDQARKDVASALAQGTTTPVVPSALKQASRTRHAALNNAIALLQQKMSASGFAKLDQFVTTAFVREVAAFSPKLRPLKRLGVPSTGR